ncbi:spore germination protein [Scopulibacillus daqui]|uniref:Spore germination protein n=1 Tax=Scopulibacillus daqui TaxID=1469162 RepID=A0ABS2PVW8_9BACL|nr:LysM peptidoglycan-binding domain-containing protein [Scopulibacillus daqui]MBM7644192.1 spore germination protein [Scopulibacillus daqui]
MNIHVVKRGETLSAISRHYKTDITTLIEINGLSDPNVLVVGQALIIPDPFPKYIVKPGDTLSRIAFIWGTTSEMIADRNNLVDPSQIYAGQALFIPVHTVQRGENLFKIAAKYHSTVQAIARVNSISNPNRIYPGTRLSIPFVRPIKEVNAYMTNFRASGQQELRTIGKYLTYVMPFSYNVKRDGTLEKPQENAVLQIARSQRILPIMVLTNSENGQFSSDLMAAIFSSDELQEKLLNNILDILRNKNYRGVNFDFEYIYPNDREHYNQFLRRAVNKFHPYGCLVSTALAPKTSSEQKGVLYEAHDYAAQGQIVDFIVLMTYEWGWAGASPQAISPIHEIKKVIDYAITVIPREKIMMGISLYGRDWKLPFVQGTFASHISPDGAVRRAAQYHAEIQYDTRAASPFFRYTDEQGTQHEVWFEDARSIKAKYDLAVQYHLRGVSYWVLGSPFTQNWYVLQEEMKPRKF